MQFDGTGYRTVDLRSDTITKPSIEMRKAMFDAEVGDDVFSEDPTVNRLQDMAADLFGVEFGLFVPSGTMANEIAIKVHTSPGDEIIIDSLSHIINFETGAPALLSGVNLIALQAGNGYLTRDQIVKAIRPDAIQFARTSLICLENTNNYGGGAVFPFEEIEKISAEARTRGIKIHLDGARIFNAIKATGISAQKYAKQFDSLTFCISKGLGAPIGSVLLGSKEFIHEARRYRKIFGGGMRQAGVLAAAGIYALENNIERLAEDHRHAKMLAEALNSTDTFEIDPNEVETNIVIFKIIKKDLSSEEAAAKFAEYGILVFPFGEGLVRAVTHMDVSRAEIEEACSRIIEHF